MGVDQQIDNLLPYHYLSDPWTIAAVEPRDTTNVDLEYPG